MNDTLLQFWSVLTIVTVPVGLVRARVLRMPYRVTAWPWITVVFTMMALSRLVVVVLDG